jgi:anti-sigma B factor antagonist
MAAEPTSPESSRRSSGLSVTVQAKEAETTLCMFGELDHFNTCILTEALGRIELDGGRPVVLDLSRLRFCDAAGVAALLAVQRRISTAGGRLRVRAPSGIPLKVLTITGADQILDID